MKCSLGISNFLEEIFSLSHSIVFLYFFALITEEGFLISPSYSLELCIQMGVSFLFFFAFSFSSFLSCLNCGVGEDSRESLEGTRSDRVSDELWMEVHDIVQDTGIKTIPMEKKCKKAKWLSGEALQIAMKRREVETKGEKER